MMILPTRISPYAGPYLAIPYLRPPTFLRFHVRWNPISTLTSFSLLINLTSSLNILHAPLYPFIHRLYRCGHIMCGSCLYGALTARGAPAQKLCPVCRTPIPDVQFIRAQTENPAPATPPPPRPAAPQPRTTRNGIRLPTAGRDMVLSQTPDSREQEPEVIDVDVDMDEPVRVEPRWDPARSGVVGLEILTLGVDEVV
ncbi:hypothetical protein RHS04_00833 [Rhizoctonia solani]|uniref:RING-type domain-containing protein n=1 Tax=Rhizoctonia solani TaxID=456999 RepID=A0A8H7LMM9_9AGAM|nr:hypothetical protein RHS04_00833 [Rhizoctonia solani]